MGNIIQFTPPVGDTANQNLCGFIKLCKEELKIFGENLSFESDVWNITGSIDTPGQAVEVRVHFCNWESSKRKSSISKADRPPMAEPFLSFAKSYLRYQQAYRPIVGMGSRLAALRALEQALLETGDASPIRITPLVLNRSCQLLFDHLGQSASYSAGRQLEMLNDFVCEHRIVITPMQWTCWLQGPQRSGVRVGKEFDERRNDKLPSPTVFRALGQIFNLATEPQDVLVTSVCALLCAAPSRISEVMRLPVECELRLRDETNNLDVLALRWWPAKGAAPMLKHVVPAMEDAVLAALKKLRQMTESGRELARWYEKNPTRIFIPPELEYLRTKKLLSMYELNSIVFEAESTNVISRTFQWCKSMEISIIKISNANYASFKDVQTAVLSLLPKNFPIMDAKTGLRYSDALLVVKRQLLDPIKATYGCVLQPIQSTDIRGRFSNTKGQGIFKRFNFTEDDGSPICLRTNQFRHYLNTLAQAGGLGQLDVAKWSGRVNVLQNIAYDHTSDHDVLARLRDAVREDSGAISPLARLHKVVFIPRDEFARLRIPTAHTTDLGYCVHDFSMLPCQVYQDCINCNEQACIKGDKVREANIRLARDETRALLKRATEAENDGDVGADTWVRHQQLTLKRLENLCNIIDDPAVQPGAVIMLSDVIPASRIEQAAQSRALLDGAVVPLIPELNKSCTSIPKLGIKVA